jgi:branched-chain amino acid transport system permease protein
LGGLVALAFAAATAIPLFRMRGFYFLIGSFAIGEAIRLIWRRAKDLFGGEGGISYIPKAEIGGFVFDSTFSYYWLTLGVVAGCLAFLYLVDQSRYGKALVAIHYQDPLCESVGINVSRYKMSAYMIASFFAGIAGGLLAHFQGAISPPQFALSFQLFVLVWVIVGGTNTFWGPISGVITLYLIQEALRGTVAEYMPLIYGVILIGMVFGLPDGFEGLPDRIRAWRMSLKSQNAT